MWLNSSQYFLGTSVQQVPLDLLGDGFVWSSPNRWVIRATWTSTAMPSAF